MPGSKEKLGLIAGNGKFPFLVLEAARSAGFSVVVAAIKEEAFPEIEHRGAASVHWLSLGELSQLIDIFHREGVHRAVMAGQVKHKQIFSAIRPDWRLAKLLLSLSKRNTDSLLGAVAHVLAEEGIMLENSTWLLEPLLGAAGVLTQRSPSEQERKNIDYGRAVARDLAQHDIGQTVVIAEAACVSVEAMEGTDATIERAGHIMASLHGDCFHPQPRADGGEDRESLIRICASMFPSSACGRSKSCRKRAQPAWRSMPASVCCWIERDCSMRQMPRAFRLWLIRPEST